MKALWQPAWTPVAGVMANSLNSVSFFVDLSTCFMG